MASLRTTDIFLFCHKTAELPRCLGEALAAGSPLVGYGSAYARDLVATNGGGAFAEVSNYRGPADTVIALDADRLKIGQFGRVSGASGRLLDRDLAIQKRIDLLNKYL
jgi:glycosyltransferase involved in cell wall biosynthesis